MSTKYILAGFIAVAGLVGFTTVQGASADTVRERVGQYSAQREGMRAERQAQLPDRLDSAVDGGLLTEEQKNLLLEKHESMQVDREQWHKEKAAMNPDERRAAAEQHREEMQEWAEQNDIPSEFNAQGQRGPAEHGSGNGGGMRWNQEG